MSLSGKSTRLLDKYVQELFMEGTVIILDHAQGNKADRDLLERFLTRMKIEHYEVKLSINEKYCSVSIKEWPTAKEI